MKPANRGTRGHHEIQVLDDVTDEETVTPVSNEETFPARTQEYFIEECTYVHMLYEQYVSFSFLGLRGLV